MGSRRLRGPGAGGAMVAAITLAMTGCTHVSDWEARSEVEDTLRQIGDASLDRYRPPAPVDAEAIRTEPARALQQTGLAASAMAESPDTFRLAMSAELGTMPALGAAGPVPDGFAPWWQPVVERPLLGNRETSEADVEALYLGALAHSAQVRVFQDIPLIRETAILEAEGEFDPHLFAEARFRHADEPVGSTLQTGGPDRFRENEWRARAGLRKRTFTGAEIEASQRIGGIDNNSVFFLPDDQARSQLALTITQPLLNRAGMEYNRATVRVARIDHEISLSELQRQVESHLLEVSRAYWSLYLERGLLAIKTRLAGETGKLLETLRARRRIDALESQIVQARAALAAREADTVRAAAAVRNAEARIVALVNDPALRMSDAAEIVPTTSPSLAARPVDVREAARHALEQRPEIDQAVNQLRAGMVRLKMSENELRPVLDLVFGATWDGLEGDFSYGRSLRTQVTEGGPGLSAGLILDVPLGNRTARARHERRRLEVRQLTSQLAATVETLMLEVQVSTREVQTAHRELTARYHEMQARAEQLASIESRGALSAAAGRPMSTVLDDLLDAQEDRAEAEQSFLRAVVTFNVAIANLDRAMGVLLQARGLEPVRGMGDGELPTLQFAPRG